jgi:hypothetical protein
VSAFAGTDLDLMLRPNRIETLILTGIITKGRTLDPVPCRRRGLQTAGRRRLLL